MADIELVIKIPEEMYASIHNGMRYTDDVRYIMDLIENGTPLPKGHGDLKDIETFKLTYGNDGAYYRFKDIIDAPTIIGAESEDRE